MFAIRAFIALVGLAGLASSALAGPPLICQPFVTDAATPMLPWDASAGWYSPHRGYDVTGLPADMSRLLSADAPVLARMENMRRAAIYADRHPAIAGALLGALLARTKSASADSQAALAWFDAGYLIETYRQLDQAYRHGMRDGRGRVSMVPAEAAGVDGYVLVRKALALASVERAEIEFAASLMGDHAEAVMHRERALANAAADPLLARNLAIFAVQ